MKNNFFNEKITTSDIQHFLNDSSKTQISSGSGLLLVKKSNTPTWQYRYKINGKAFVYTIGNLNNTTLNQAREQHRELFNKVLNGENVAVNKQREKHEVKISTSGNPKNYYSISTLAEFYLNNNKSLSGKNTPYVKNTTSLIKRLFIDATPELFTNNNNDFLQRPASEINELDVIKFIESIKHKTTKRKAADLLYSIFKKANTYKITTKITANPAEIIKDKNEISFDKSRRERIVSDAELKELFKLLNNSKNKMLATATKLLFLLAVRKQELLKAEWKEFDFINKIWTLPAERSKNNKAIKIPLSNLVIKLLNSLETKDKSNYLFISNSTRRPQNSLLSNATLNLFILNLIKGNNIIKSSIHPHDARHYSRTTLSKILDGDAVENQFICERVLNHSINIKGINQNILNTYLQDDFISERRKALDKLAEHINNITTSD